MPLTPPSSPIPLPEWIRRAGPSLSAEDYVACAVTVAFELAGRLSVVVGSHSQNSQLVSSPCPCDDSLNVTYVEFPPPDSSLRTEDVVSENVMVSVAADDDNVRGTSSSRNNFTATKVTVLPSADLGLPGDAFDAPRPPSQPDLCVALGNIFLDLFSRGDRPPPIDLVEDVVNEYSFADLLIEEGDESTSHSPASKKVYRAKKSTGSQTKAKKAGAFLRDQGLPASVCRLVTDLLEGEGGNNPYQPDTAILTLGEARFDLARMKTHPRRFLHDESCPAAALERTSLSKPVDGELYGRESEIASLLDAASRVSHMSACEFLCEAVFLYGHSGSGKSTIAKQLVSFCDEGDWLVFACKFDRRAAPLSVLVQMFDAFFGSLLPARGQDGEFLERSPSVQWTGISRSLTSSIDGVSFCQLCELLPNLGKLFPLSSSYLQNKRKNVTPTDDDSLSSVGSGSSRLGHLFHVLFEALCAGGEGRPVAIVAEDLQWSDAFSMDVLGDFVRFAAGSGSSLAAEGRELYQARPRLLLAGNYRDNEVEPDGFLMNQIESMEQCGGNVHVSRVEVGELGERQINDMLSFKFCLPTRHTRELAGLVFHKTRGNPMYVIEFLRHIIQNNMMSFSVKERRWIWDDILIDIQMISEGVVELLTRKLRQLQDDVIKTLQVLSCFGQADISTIELLNLGQFVPDMMEALEVATKEGIIERAGPLFAFTHDMLQESMYITIPAEERMPLHKRIGTSLAQCPGINDNPNPLFLAMDQINRCKDADGILNPSERALFARLNLAAGKHSIAASSYGQARGYFEAGIGLLCSRPWDKQYALCLELHEMSVAASLMDGRVEAVPGRLADVLSNARSFGDALESRALCAKFLASQARYGEAMGEMLAIISYFGEEFPRDAGLERVTDEVEATRQLLEGVTTETILDLPTIEDTKKLNAMKFIDLLIVMAGNFSSPMLVPLLSCRLMKLTFEFGFCEHTISGLASMPQALLYYLDDIQLARQVGRIAESLISGNIYEHSLRARLTWMSSTAKSHLEPFQSVPNHFLNGYNSAKIVGDVDNTILCGMLFCMAQFFCVPELSCLQKHMVAFFNLIANHKRIGMLYTVMSTFDAVIGLAGKRDLCNIDARIEMKNNEELYPMAEHGQSTYLMHQVVTNQMYVHCYFREFLLVSNLGDKYRRMLARTKNTGTKRVLDIFQIFFGGISALCLARDTREEKWRKIGEEFKQQMAKLLEYSTWNFENKFCLLQAELYYLNGCHGMADLSYQASITSARDHKFVNEEALAYELYGIYLVENKMAVKGIQQLRMAMYKYKKWGAIKKADDVKNFIELVKQSVTLWNQEAEPMNEAKY